MTILAEMFQQDKIARLHLYDKRDELAKAQGLMLRAPSNCTQNKRTRQMRRRPTVSKTGGVEAKKEAVKAEKKEAVKREKEKKENAPAPSKLRRAKPVAIHGAEVVAWLNDKAAMEEKNKQVIADGGED